MKSTKMPNLRLTTCLAVSTALLFGCAIHKPSFAPGDPCITGVVTISDDFAGARRGQCTVLSESAVAIEIRREDDAVVNESPWYAFKITTSSSEAVTIELHYPDSRHRYIPKLSVDGSRWETIDPDAVTFNGAKTIARLTFVPPAADFYLTAQELVLPSHYSDWVSINAETLGVQPEVIGNSRAGRPIHLLDTGGETNDVLLIVGRQHPPEVSGAFAFLSFGDTLLGDSDLAVEFRSRFRVLAVPLMNPDGVVDGHWRHNLGSTDLNRDWGPFTQPETQAIKSLLERLDNEGAQIRAFADIHSTDRNLFYTQDDDHPTTPPDFVPTWLDRSAERLSNYEFTNEERTVSEQANSKNYMYRRYGIPAVTYEVGDETERRAVIESAEVFAEELMTLMLCHADVGWQTACQ